MIGKAQRGPPRLADLSGMSEYLWLNRHGAFPRPAYSARTSTAMLMEIRSADFVTESRARCA